MRDNLTDLILEAHRAAVAAGTLPDTPLPPWKLELPNNPDHGDYATNLAMVLARAAKMAPRAIAAALLDALDDPNGLLAGTEVAGPGFINFRLQPAAWNQVLGAVEEQADRYGFSRVGEGRSVQVEFVSANPTGPLHVGHGRGAVVGDTLARILAAAGFTVQREYYVNDAGNQMGILGRSVYLRYLEAGGRAVEFPENHYRGEYIREFAAAARQKWGARFEDTPEAAAVEELGLWAGGLILDDIRDDLARFGVRFDRWFSEKQLHDTGEVERILGELEERGVAYREEGALWLRTAGHGDDKNRVLVKGDGLKTYFASDIAYHLDKFARGFDQVVNVWGADHHGYVPRVKAALDTVGIDPERLHVLLVQFVSLLRDGKPVGMSTRSGEFVTLRQVVEEVGRDAARFLFLTRSCDTALDFDLEVAKRQTADNPVFYVQYAHARICSVYRQAAAEGLAVPRADAAALFRLQMDEERELLKLLYHYPETVEGAALFREPHRPVYYLQELAARFHSYYNKCRFLDEDRELSGARLTLAGGVRQVLRNGLTLLGVAAPETM
ncbi:MAG: arginine--tRNA ligase [Deferrisomatales bacterium]|nr:arginine--tRNA ligase [Deferrisomatales bacterium]